MHFHDRDKLLVTPPLFVACVLGARRRQARRDKELNELDHDTAPLRTETLVKALAEFISFWAQHGPPGAETLVNA